MRTIAFALTLAAVNAFAQDDSEPKKVAAAMTLGGVTMSATFLMN